jgi:hypothetical protein
MDEGRIIKTGGNYLYEYHLKDHLGNTRVAFEVTDAGMNVRQVSDYYPFGMRHLPVVPDHDNDYLYNGKELQTELELDWYDYGMRYYDPQLGRFHT